MLLPSMLPFIPAGMFRQGGLHFERKGRLEGCAGLQVQRRGVM